RAQRAAGLAAVLRGQAGPADNRERLAFVEVCRFKDLPAAAARLYEEAFTQEPGLAEDVRAGKRYAAARAAARAGCGRGKDRPPPDGAARARWRRQARDWLRADLKQWGRLLGCGPPPARRSDTGSATPTCKACGTWTPWPVCPRRNATPGWTCGPTWKHCGHGRSPRDRKCGPGSRRG